MPSVEREPLSRERILQAALGLVDREGIDALSMRRLGRALGVEAMSLYNHIPNKAALLSGLVEALLAEIHPLVGPTDDWQARMRAVMRATRAAAHAHPQIFVLFTRRPGPTIALSRRGTDDIATLRAAGFSPDEAAYALRTLVGFVSGFVLREIGTMVAAHDETEGAPSDDATAALAAARASGLAAPIPARSDAGFEFGLSIILDGLQRQLERQSAVGVAEASATLSS